MSTRRIANTVLTLVVLALLVSCAAPQTPAPATQAPAAPAPTQPPAATEAPAAPAETKSTPTEVRIAVITCCSLESQWDATFVKAMERVQAEKPRGMNLTFEVTENTFGDDALPVMQNYAESGKYDIIWTNSTYSDQVEKIMDQYPEIMFVVSGSGNRGLGKNQYWVYMRVHEPAYLLGTLAGKLTKNNRVGAVGTFAFDDVNDEINAFFQGAKDANPNVKATVSFIESWYDPVKGNEATVAQVAAGVDWMLQLADGWEACATKNIMCFGNFGDQNPLAPKNVPNSTLSLWDPAIRWAIDQWWAHKAEGKPYDGNKEPVWFGMAKGGSDIGEWHGFDTQLPKDAVDALKTKRQEILDGKFTVPLNIETPKSDPS